MPRTRLRLALGAVLLGLAACEDHLSRRETLSVGAGDAIAANRAVHTIDPWPRSAQDTAIPVSGRRVVTAIEAYEARGADAGKGSASPLVLAPVAVPAPGGGAP